MAVKLLEGLGNSIILLFMFANRDAWWETETECYRQWKNYFPKENQEIIIPDKKTGEEHIADIKTDDGLVIKIQDSPISEAEIFAKEQLHELLIWIVNGANFVCDFVIFLEKLPKPYSDFYEDIVFFPKNSKPLFASVPYFRKSENLEYVNWVNSGCVGFSPRLRYGSWHRHSLKHHEFLQKIEDNYIGHHLFEWKKPTKAWFSATKPVYIDFGTDTLWLMQKYYKDRDLWCVQKFSKESLISKLGGFFPSYRPL